MGRDSLPDRSVFRPGTIAADPLTLTLSPEGERGLAPPLLHFLLPSRLREGPGEGGRYRSFRRRELPAARELSIAGGRNSMDRRKRSAIG